MKFKILGLGIFFVICVSCAPQRSNTNNEVHVEYEDGQNQRSHAEPYITSELVDHDRHFPERGDIPLNTKYIYGWNCTPNLTPPTRNPNGTPTTPSTPLTPAPSKCWPVIVHPPSGAITQPPTNAPSLPNLPPSFPHFPPNFPSFPNYPTFPYYHSFGGFNSAFQNIHQNHFTETQYPSFIYYPPLQNHPNLFPNLPPLGNGQVELLPDFQPPQIGFPPLQNIGIDPNFPNFPNFPSYPWFPNENIEPLIPQPKPVNTLCANRPSTSNPSPCANRPPTPSPNTGGSSRPCDNAK